MIAVMIKELLSRVKVCVSLFRVSPISLRRRPFSRILFSMLWRCLNIQEIKPWAVVYPATSCRTKWRVEAKMVLLLYGIRWWPLWLKQTFVWLLLRWLTCAISLEKARMGSTAYLDLLMLQGRKKVSLWYVITLAIVLLLIQIMLHFFIIQI